MIGLVFRWQAAATLRRRLRCDERLGSDILPHEVGVLSQAVATQAGFMVEVTLGSDWMLKTDERIAPKRMTPARIPSLSIEGGLAGRLIAQVLIAKYCDHLSLYRQSGIFAHEGSRSNPRRWPVGPPIALDALKRIGKLFEIERLIQRQASEPRRKARQELPLPPIADLARFPDRSLAEMARKSDLAKAHPLRPLALDGAHPHIDDGRLAISNNAAERAISTLKLGTKD